MHPNAITLIERLGLRPHPEGGFFTEVYRSASRVQPLDGRPVRAALTTIYFLLPEGMHSRWHRVTSDEVWHLYEGGPLELFQAPSGIASIDSLLLGPAATTTTGPVHTVPAGWWQAARSQGPYVLVGCTVGPGFDYDDFSFLRDDAVDLAKIQQIDPALAQLA